MVTIETVDACSLVLDYNLYPRHEVNPVGVNDIVQAMSAKKTLPPVIADRKTRRVVDGFHRTQAALKLLGDDAKVKVEWRTYKNDGELFLDAMRLNAIHGQKFSPYDRARCVVLGEELKLEPAWIADALCITVEKYTDLTTHKIAQVLTPNGIVPHPIKQTASWLAGKRLTAKQVEGNELAGGRFPSFYVNQVTMMLQHGLINRDDEKLMNKLVQLQHVLNAFLGVKQKV